MKSRLILAMFLLAAFSGCYEKYDHTYELCDNKLYVETYHNSVIDIGYKYLTDSCNFRIYVGKYDNEHGGIYI